MRVATTAGGRLLNNGMRILVVAAALGAMAVRGRPRDPKSPTAAVERPPAKEGVPAAQAPLHEQKKRAAEPKRGRNAVAPWHIPWLGWKDILWRTYKQVDEDRVLAVAAGVTFFALLAFFPAVSTFVSIYGLFADYSTINEHLSFAASVMPSGGYDILREQVERIISREEAALSLALVFSGALTLWSANAGMKAIIDALNIAYEEPEKRSFIKLNLISLCFTVGAVAGLLLALATVVVFPLMLSQIGLADYVETIIFYARWPFLLVAVIIGLAVIYRFGPSRSDARWEWVSVGSIVAALAWLSGSILLSWYLQNFADYNATYGSLGAAIGFMTWLWLSSTVLILGAELNSEIEHQTARDSTTGPEKPLGSRGATMADTVGEAQSPA